MSATSSAGVIYADLSPCGRGGGARASQGCWIIHGKQSRPKALGFRDPRFESRCIAEYFKKICIRKQPYLDKVVLRGFDIRELHCHGGGNHGGNRGGNRVGNGGRDGDDNDGFNGSNDSFIFHWWTLSINGLIIYWQVFSRDKMGLNRALLSLYVVGYFCYTQLFSALAKTSANGCPQSGDSSIHRSSTGVKVERGAEVNGKGEMPDVVWEVKGGRWRKVLLDYKQDEFVVDGVRGRQDEARTSEVEKKNEISQLVFGKRDPEGIFSSSLTWCKGLVLRLMLPEGYPESVTSDYLEYSLWRMGQVIASQIGGVLTTQALLYAVGLGKGAIPTAAAVNWVLKDGIGYLSKILLSKYGRHFDVHPKGWRLFADLLENAACGMELLTPVFPHFFVYLGAVAGAGRSAAGLIQAATRSCFYAGFAAQRNFAEVIAKGEAQGLVSKSLGIMFGIALSNYTGSSGPLVVASFAVVTSIHMFCNLKSYQAVQLRTLNPYRASLIFIEYLHSGCIPSIKEVNDEEPIFAAIPLFSAMLKSCQESSQALSIESKEAAAQIDANLQLGSKFKDIVHSQEEANALFNLYQNERYLLAKHEGKFLVMLKGGATPQDMLRAMFQVCHLCWLERHLGIKSRGTINDCKPGGKLAVSHDYLEREFTNVQQSATKVGWLAEGLVARPLPFRVHFNYVIP